MYSILIYHAFGDSAKGLTLPELFNRCDSNSDGSLGINEMVKFAGEARRPQLKDLIRRLDNIPPGEKQGDGEITKEEFANIA